MNIIDPNGSLVLIALSLALGAFVGLRREMEMQERGVPGFVGFRTMPLITLLGCLSTMFVQFSYLPVIGLVAIIVFLAIAYYNGVFQLQLLGLTSELATLIMFLVGVLVGYGHIVEAIVVSIVVGMLTAFKGAMHQFARTISAEEWSGALQLLIITAVVLPILPRTAVDPWGVIVPYDIWLVVIFISAIGFVGYFLNKYMGERRGIVLTSIVGSLVSSTVVTTHLATLGHQEKHKNNDLLVMGVVMAIATMLLRVLFVLLVITPREYVAQVALVPLGMLIATALCGLYWYGRSQDELADQAPDREQVPVLQSPFEIIPAVRFAALFIVVLLMVQLGQTYFGAYGVVATTFFSAFADVDAAIVSVIQTLRGGGLEIAVVSLVVTVAIVVNTMVKALYVWLLSRNVRLSQNIMVVTCISSVVGVGVYMMV